MADDADLANDLIELQLKSKLDEIGSQAIPENDTGACLYCGEPVPDSRRWCSAECRDLDTRRK
jgi:RNA polymerase-binding transcription factor DksA